MSGRKVRPNWFIIPDAIWVVFRYEDPEDSFFFYSRRKAREFLVKNRLSFSGPKLYYLGDR